MTSVYLHPSANNALLKALYEVDRPAVSTDGAGLEHIENEAVMWRHRQRVTVEHLSMELEQQGQQGEHTLLRLFLKMVCHPAWWL